MIRAIKWGIWLYLFLLIFEGALRKWVAPSLSDVILIIRDPVVLGIYVLALGAGIVPRNAFLSALLMMACGSFVFAYLAGQTNIWVTLYGLRINYLHVPLIWVMAAALTRKDVERMGFVALMMAIPMGVIMRIQFSSPIGSFINRGIGGDAEGGQIYGALGHIRPPGFFSFITGPMVFFPLVMAFFLHRIVTEKKFIPLICVATAGSAIVTSLYLSISRGTMITTGLVVLMFVLCLLRTGLRTGGLNLVLLLRFAAASVLLVIGISFLPVFHEAREAFMDRWDTAAAQSDGRGWGSLVDRVLGVIFTPIEYASQADIFGRGIGVGSNVGSRLLTGEMGFLLAEDEWGKILLELGPALGGCFILFRLCLAGYLFLVAWRTLMARADVLPLLLWMAAAPVIVLHQWGPPTLLGFAVFGGGLCLASTNEQPPELEEDDDEFDDDEDSDEAEDEEAAEPISEFEAQRRRMRGL